MSMIAIVVPIAGAIGLAYAFVKAKWVKAQDAGDVEMVTIANRIHEGAMDFLADLGVGLFRGGCRHIVAIATWMVTLRPRSALSFVVGAVCSGLAGYLGMRVATDANVRTTQAAKDLPTALNVAFSGGAVMGMSVVGLALLGLGILWLVCSGCISLR